MKHESFFCLSLVIMFAVFVCTALFPNCAGTQHRDAGEPFGGDSYAAGKLEATVKELDRITSDSRERIRNAVKASRSIEDGIERIEFLFGKYEQEVGRRILLAMTASKIILQLLRFKGIKVPYLLALWL